MNHFITYRFLLSLIILSQMPLEAMDVFAQHQFSQASEQDEDGQFAPNAYSIGEEDEDDNEAQDPNEFDFDDYDSRPKPENADADGYGTGEALFDLLNPHTPANCGQVTNLHGDCLVVPNAYHELAPAGAEAFRVWHFGQLSRRVEAGSTRENGTEIVCNALRTEVIQGVQFAFGGSLYLGDDSALYITLHDEEGEETIYAVRVILAEGLGLENAEGEQHVLSWDCVTVAGVYDYLSVSENTGFFLQYAPLVLQCFQAASQLQNREEAVGKFKQLIIIALQNVIQLLVEQGIAFETGECPDSIGQILESIQQLFTAEQDQLVEPEENDNEQDFNQSGACDQ